MGKGRRMWSERDLDHVIKGDGKSMGGSSFELPPLLHEQRSNPPYTPYTPSGVVKKRCYHSGDDVVATLKCGATIGGAQKSSLNPYCASLILDASGYGEPMKAFVKHVPPALGLDLLKDRALEYVPPIVTLEWADRAAPNASPAFWITLLKVIKPEWHVVGMCIGGHGRTGTILSSILVADGWKAEEAITHVREHHCEDAVESVAQVEYVHWLEEQFAFASLTTPEGR